MGAPLLPSSDLDFEFSSPQSIAIPFQVRKFTSFLGGWIGLSFIFCNYERGICICMSTPAKADPIPFNLRFVSRSSGRGLHPGGSDKLLNLRNVFIGR